jgi:hypothetical protein
MLRDAIRKQEGGYLMEADYPTQVGRFFRYFLREISPAARYGGLHKTAGSARGIASLNGSFGLAGSWGLVMLIMLGATASVHGQTAPQPRSLSLQDAIAIAEGANPESAIATGRDREAEADLRTAPSASPR